ncbi:MAG TPA: hypothetical protein VNA04_18120 [Thermoanaerobaculia bacterium]|nr:hypothetical protein [Thermoanaerobaculia bacterium]
MNAMLAVAMIVLVVVHLLAGKLRFKTRKRRRAWLSAAGGISVTYVFLDLLPELAEGQEVLRDRFAGLAFLEDHVYLVALAGLAGFYGVEVFVRHRRKPESRAPTSEDDWVFWIHIASFAVYNALIGYLMVEREPYEEHLPAYTVAMSLHFLVTDYGLRDHHDAIYDRKGRWVLGGAIALGYLFGMLAQVSEALVSVVAAFVAGGAILNVMKEELPEERRGQFPAFASGVVVAAILLTVT